MSNQQNFVGQAATDRFDLTWNDALSVPFEVPTFNFNGETSGAPSFQDSVHYGPQETQVGGNSLDNDVQRSYSTPWPPMNSGIPTPQPDPISNEYLVNEVTELLHKMRIFYHDNLCAIEGLLRKRDNTQRRRSSNFRNPRTDPTTTLPLPLSHQFRDITYDKLWPDHEPQPSVSRAGPSHNNFTRASSTHSDVCMDSGCIIASNSQHPTFTVIKAQCAKRFLCECGHKTKTKGDMLRHHETLRHAEPKYACSCGVSYTRGDGLRRHQKKCKCRA